MLRNICKYYMKIILIYSAIVSTLDPSYHYFDENYKKIEFYLKDFDSYKDVSEDKVGIITGDIQLNKEAPCLILTTEILRTMIYDNDPILQELDCVVFDEIHYIFFRSLLFYFYRLGNFFFTKNSSVVFVFSFRKTFPAS